MLCAHSLDLVRKPSDALADLAWLAATVPTVRLVYEDADVASRAVRELLVDPPHAPAVDWDVSSPSGAAAAQGEPADAAIVAAEGSGLVELDGEAFVFEPVERRLVGLTPEAVSLWKALPWVDEVSPELRTFAGALEEVGIVRIVGDSGS